MLTQDTVQGYVERGLVREVPHPSLPLTLYCYSKLCVIEGAWDEVTRACRGLVFDNDTGKPVNNPMPKFFNSTEDYEWPDHDQFFLCEKLDGSMICVFKWEHRILTHTKGSWQHEFAYRAKMLLPRAVLDLINERGHGFTAVFEYLSPKSQMVVDYGEGEQLKLLAFRPLGDEWTSDVVASWAEHMGVPCFQWHGVFRRNNILFLESIDMPGIEGWVLDFFGRGRLKIKTQWYVDRHRIVSAVTSKNIWELLRDDKLDDIDHRILPPHLREKFHAEVKRLRDLLIEYRFAALEEARHAHKTFDNRKAQALWITRNSPRKHLTFCALDHGDLDRLVEACWKHIGNNNLKEEL